MFTLPIKIVVRTGFEPVRTLFILRSGYCISPATTLPIPPPDYLINRNFRFTLKYRLPSPFTSCTSIAIAMLAA